MGINDRKCFKKHRSHWVKRKKKTIISFEKGREDVLLYYPFLGRWLGDDSLSITECERKKKSDKINKVKWP